MKQMKKKTPGETVWSPTSDDVDLEYDAEREELENAKMVDPRDLRKPQFGPGPLVPSKGRLGEDVEIPERRVS